MRPRAYSYAFSSPSHVYPTTITLHFILITAPSGAKIIDEPRGVCSSSFTNPLVISIAGSSLNKFQNARESCMPFNKAATKVPKLAISLPFKRHNPYVVGQKAFQILFTREKQRDKGKGEGWFSRMDGVQRKHVPTTVLGTVF